jgi:hypothetical protein
VIYNHDFLLALILKTLSMIDTYDSAADAAVDRTQQQALFVALNAWDRALRRDECSAWSINGNAGTIHTFGDGASWVLYVACRSALHWTHTKKRLAFCKVLLDCEGEGTLRLYNRPTSDQANAKSGSASA